MLNRPSLRLAALLMIGLLAALLLAGCSGSDSGTATPALPTSTAFEQPSATPAAAEPTSEPTAPPAETTTEPTAAPTETPAPPAATVTPEPPAATATPRPDLTLSVYFLRDEKIATAHRVIPHTLQVAEAAVRSLLEGPTPDEAGLGMSSAIPDGVAYLGTTINAGTATVNLSSQFGDGGGSMSMQARAAQVVYTLTQFPTIENVIFQMDGVPITALGGEGLALDTPQTRADFEDLTPQILVENPAPFDEISFPLTFHGTANTFEATYLLQVLDADGNVLHEDHYMATSGTGTRGTFEETIDISDVSPGDALTLRFFTASARDGSDENVVEIPVTVGD